MTVNAANTTRLNVGSVPAYQSAVAVFLALLGAGAAWTLAPFVNGKPTVAVASAVFPILLIVLLWLPAFQCLRFGSRIILILLALRPLVDVSMTSFQPDSAGFTLKASSGLSLQEGFAAALGLILLVVWLAGRHCIQYTKLPNIFLIVLLALTSLSWLTGGLGEGARGFARTAWGLLVALLLGSLFRTEKQIDIFVRTVFYSSFFVLTTLGLNLGRGLEGASSDAIDEVWRLAGQYGTPNALAGVAFSFFLCGLYVLGRSRTAFGKSLSLLLLSLLALVIVLTQSRTIGGLMLMSVCIWLWSSHRRWLLCGTPMALLLFLLGSTAGTGWRLISSFSLSGDDVNPNVLTLQGRIVLWGEWLTNYLDTSLFHKAFGLGWGVVLRNFLSMGFTSSVTENSFLWFLVGTGALGFLAFCGYLFWVLFRAGGAWRRASSNFQRQFALLAFLTTLSFVIEAFTTDVASAPNANVYIFAVMSIFVFQWLRDDAWRFPKLVNNQTLKEPETAY